MGESGFCDFCESENMSGMLIDTYRGPAFICYDCADDMEQSIAPEIPSMSPTAAVSPEVTVHMMCDGDPGAWLRSLGTPTRMARIKQALAHQGDAIPTEALSPEEGRSDG